VKFRELYLISCIFLILSFDGLGQLPSITFGNSGNASGCVPHTVVLISHFIGEELILFVYGMLTEISYCLGINSIENYSNKPLVNSCLKLQ